MAPLQGFAKASGEGASGGSGGSGVAALSGAVSKSSSSSIATSKKPDASTTSTSTTAAPPTKRTKKRGPTKKGSVSSGGGGSSADNVSSAAEEETKITPLSETTSNFKPLSLQQIKLRLNQLIDKLPKDLPAAPSDYNNDTTDNTLYETFAPIKKWASAIQVNIEEYNLILSLVSAATYKWGVDRSGASQQNLSVMSAELQQCQETISSVVSTRLSNVLCPAVDVMIGEVEIICGKGDKGDGDDKAPAKKRKLNDDRLSATATNSNNEKRINHYTRPLVDPNYVHLCHCILARNSEMIRHTVATSIYTAQKVIGDYLNAMKKDSSHEASKGGYY